ncbi:MAG: hypothetical protein ABSH20_11270 [Tepidisphaeraceae bacterium]|jgi:hypothetical protein
MKKTARFVAGLAIVAVGGTAMTLMAAEKLGIGDVMKKAFKGKQSLLVKVTEGRASADEAKELLDLVKVLGANKPPHGDMASWKTRTDAIVKAAEGVVAGTKGAAEELRAATNCKACHNVHNPE